MSFPVDPPPPEGEQAPVWDVTGTRWSWVEESSSFVCDDPDFTGPPVTNPGAIPVERQPFYAAPPTELQQRLAQHHPEEGDR